MTTNRYALVALALVSSSSRSRYVKEASAVASEEDLRSLVANADINVDHELVMRVLQRDSVTWHVIWTELPRSYFIDKALLTQEVIATQEIYSVDGNMVRKHTSHTREIASPEKQEVLSLEFWTDGHLSQNEELELRDAIEALIHGSLKIGQAFAPIRGSFLQTFQLIGLSRYVSNVVANLRSAFSTVATNQNAEAVLKLSKIIENHANIVIRFEDVVAIKITRNKVAHVLIEKMSPAVEAAVARDSGILRRPLDLLELFEKGADVVPLRRAKPSGDAAAAHLPGDPGTAANEAARRAP